MVKETKTTTKKKDSGNTRKQNQVKLRGRTFEGNVVKILPGRLAIEFDRLIYHSKYERYEKRKSKMHARIPAELEGQISVGDRVQIAECRPLSKIMHAIVTKIIANKNTVAPEGVPPKKGGKTE